MKAASVLGCGNTGPGAWGFCKPSPGCKRAVKPVCAWRPIPVSWLLFLYGQVLDRLLRRMARQRGGYQALEGRQALGRVQGGVAQQPREIGRAHV